MVTQSRKVPDVWARCDLCERGVFHFHYTDNHLREVEGIIELGTVPKKTVEKLVP